MTKLLVVLTLLLACLLKLPDSEAKDALLPQNLTATPVAAPMLQGAT